MRKDTKKQVSREKSSFPKRVRRYTAVSQALVRIGSGTLKHKLLATQAPRQKHAEQIRLALGGLKGPLMKVAQILATIPDLVPKEYADEFLQLQADAPPMGWPFVRRRMSGELGTDWEKKFQFFDHTASHAASLGQVHKAITIQGETVACKLQYPDMRSTVDADLYQLKILFSFFELYDKAVSTKKVQQEIADRLYEELDYTREGKAIKLYQHMLRLTEGVSVPVFHPHLSTRQLLVMSWLDGNRLSERLQQLKDKERNQIANNMFHAWYNPFYYYGVIHGDPHLGNYTVRRDLGINLLDYGCIRVFRPELVQGVIQLYQALEGHREDEAVESYRALGFKNPNKELIGILNIWARFIYAPLLEDRTRLIEETNTGLYGRETARKVHIELRKIGGIEIPREFVFMDRAAVGLGSVFLRLRAEINWYKMFHELIKDFDLKLLKSNQIKALRKAGLEP